MKAYMLKWDKDRSCSEGGGYLVGVDINKEHFSARLDAVIE